MADFVSDTFTDTSGTALASHTGETGAGWTEHSSYGTGDIVISDANRARATTTNVNLYYASGTPAGVEYSVSSLIRCVTSINCRVGVAGRVSTSAADYYLALYRVFTGWQLFRVQAGGFTQLGASTASPAFETGATEKTLKLDITDAAKKLLVDAVEIISNADNVIVAAGRAGLWYGNFNATTNATGYHWDNFVANEAGGGGPTQPPRSMHQYRLRRTG